MAAGGRPAGGANAVTDQVSGCAAARARQIVTLGAQCATVTPGSREGCGTGPDGRPILTLIRRFSGGRVRTGAGCRNNAPVATATANLNSVPTPAHGVAKRPDLVSVGIIVWLANELMFFAALFAMYFTIRSVITGNPDLGAWPGADLNVPWALTITVVLVASSFTSQFGVWAAERGDVKKLRMWFFITFFMGLFFISGQAYEYYELLTVEGLTLQSSPYGSVFFLTTGFHGLHVIGGLIAFLIMLGRTYAAKRFTHQQATSAIVVSYYWHFVDVVWVALFISIYFIQ